MSSSLEASADILKVPRVHVPGRQEAFPFDLSAENTVEEASIYTLQAGGFNLISHTKFAFEIERVLERAAIKDEADNYEMKLTYRDETRANITIPLDPNREVASYDRCFKLIVNGMSDVTIHIVPKSDQVNPLQTAIKKK